MKIPTILTQLSTLKSRLAIPDADTTYDALLTSAARARTARFDKECNRTFARTEGATFEFDAADTELSPPCYPIEAITKWETNSSETDGWTEKSGADYLIRNACVISLRWPIIYSPPSPGRITYTRGLRPPRHRASSRPDPAARRPRTSPASSKSPSGSRTATTSASKPTGPAASPITNSPPSTSSTPSNPF